MANFVEHLVGVWETINTRLTYGDEFPGLDEMMRLQLICYIHVNVTAQNCCFDLIQTHGGEGLGNFSAVRTEPKEGTSWGKLLGGKEKGKEEGSW